jgi:YVTN family beta-propeller protein
MAAMVVLPIKSVLAGEACPISYSSGATVVAVSTNPVQELPQSPITVGFGPEAVAVTRDGNYALVTDEGSGQVSVIRVSDNTVVSTPFLTGFGQVEKIVVTPTRAYITIEGDGLTFKEIDITTSPDNYQVVREAPLGCSIEGVAITPDLTELLVTYENLNRVVVLRTSDLTQIASISVGSEPENAAVSPTGSPAIVTNTGSFSASAIGTDPTDPTTYHQVIATIAVGYFPQGVAFNLTGTKAYVANIGDGTVSEIDISTLTVTNTIDVGGDRRPYGVAAHPNGHQIWVTNGGYVTVIEVPSYMVASYRLASATSLFGIAITPDGNFAYMANQLGP